MQNLKCNVLLEEKHWESRNRECTERGHPAPSPAPVWVSPFKAGFGQVGDCNN